MDLKTYQEWVYRRTATGVPADDHALLGLASEVGEIADALKRELVYGVPTERVQENLAEEAGDLIFYLAMLATSRGFTLQEAIDKNVEKLERRYPLGKFTQEHAIARLDKEAA